MEDSAVAASYIRMVQYMIENCLVYHMSRKECVESLLKHGNINPAITNTVWKELEKENLEFFRSYRKELDELDHECCL